MHCTNLYNQLAMVLLAILAGYEVYCDEGGFGIHWGQLSTLRAHTELCVTARHEVGVEWHRMSMENTEHYRVKLVTWIWDI